MTTTTSPEGSQEHAPPDRFGADPPPGAGTEQATVEFDAGHQAADPHVRHRRPGRQAGQAALELSGPGLHVGQDVPLLEQLQVAESDRGSEGVATKAMAVIQRGRTQILTEEGVGDPARRGRGAHRQIAAGQTLPQAQQVRPQPALLRGEQCPCAPETSRHLVADEQHAGVLASGAEAADLVRFGHMDARRALHQRLDNDRGQAAGIGSQRRQGPLQPVRRRVARGAHHTGKTEQVEQLGPEPAGADRQRADRVAVIGVAQGQVGRPLRLASIPPVLEGDLQGLLDRGGAVGREQEAGVVDRHHARPTPRPARPPRCCRGRATSLCATRPELVR